MLRHRIVEPGGVGRVPLRAAPGEVAGRPVDDNEIKRILRESDEVAERRAAWEASKTVGASVADDVRELARLRNEAARSLGYRDWFALAVATSEMDEARLFETLDECDRLTADAFAGWKAEPTSGSRSVSAARSDELRPWHYEDPFFQEVPAAGGVDLTGASRARTSSRSRARRTTASASTRERSSTAATSSRATGSASTRSASTSTARATSACSRTSRTTATGRTRCSTSSGTAPTTSASTAHCRGSCATATSPSPRASRS